MSPNLRNLREREYSSIVRHGPTVPSREDAPVSNLSRTTYQKTVPGPTPGSRVPTSTQWRYRRKVGYPFLFSFQTPFVDLNQTSTGSAKCVHSESEYRVTGFVRVPERTNVSSDPVRLRSTHRFTGPQFPFPKPPVDRQKDE